MTVSRIGTDLERHRLRLRAERIRQVLRSLEPRQREYAARGVPRVPLEAAIRDFHAELRAIHGRIGELHPRARIPAGDSRVTRQVG